MLDHVASLERAAHTTLHLVQELQSSQAEVTSSLTGADGSGGSDGSNVNTEPGDSNAGASSTAALPSLRSPLPSDTDKARRDYMLRSMKLIMGSSFVRTKMASGKGMPPEIRAFLKKVGMVGDRPPE